MELDPADLDLAAKFSYAAYASPYSAWGGLEALGVSTGAGGWIVNGSPEWASTYGAPLGGVYESDGGVQISPGTDAIGFFENNSSTAIAAVKDGVLIVAIRGGGDSPADREEALNDPLAHYERLQPFIDDIFQFVQDPSNGITEVIITGHSLGGEMAQLFASNYTVGGTTHASDVSALGLPPSSVSIITFGNPGLPFIPDTTFTVSDVWASRTINVLNTDDGAISAFPHAGQDYAIDLNTVPATAVPPLPDVSPFIADEELGEHHPANYVAAIEVIASSPGFFWINTNDITLFGIGDDHDNSSVSAPGGSYQARFVLGLAGSDMLTGNNGNDVLDGGTGSDTLHGLAGDDQLYGGAENDAISGGAGIDTAHFDGAFGSYSVSTSTSGGIQTTTVQSSAGTDTLTGVEFLQFQDALVFVPGPKRSDFDGNGTSDIIWQNDNGEVAVWLMDDATKIGGGFVGSNPGPEWHVKGTGDFNDDGKSDILWQHDDGRAAVWLLNGAVQIGGAVVGTSPGSAWHVITSGDFNGDGKSDILWQHDDGRAAVSLLDGTTLIGAAMVENNPGRHWHVKDTGDFNGDGKSDILWQNDDGRAAVWLLDGTTQIGSAIIGGNPGPEWRIKSSGDFNGDGKSDILWQNAVDNRVAVWLVDGTTQIAGAVLGPNLPYWQVEGAGDFDGDGKSDILWQHIHGQPAIWFVDGTTLTGTVQVPYSSGLVWQIANYGTGDREPHDLDRDGNTDLLWQNTSGGQAVWLLNGTSHAGGKTWVDLSWELIDYADFDGDGHADLLQQQSTNGQVKIHLMSGATVLTSGYSAVIPSSSWHAITTADFNRDGKSDILWQHTDGSVNIWFMDAWNRIGNADLSPSVSSAWHVKDTGDFNRDGRPDILWQNDDGSAAIWLMDGVTRIASSVVGSNLGPAWHVIGAGDFNGDGKSDILWQNNDGRAAVWLMNGTQFVAGSVVGNNPGSAWHVIGADDFNNDAKSDILWQHDNGQAAVWLMNGVISTEQVLIGANLGSDWHLVWA